MLRWSTIKPFELDRNLVFAISVAIKLSINLGQISTGSAGLSTLQKQELCL